MKAGRNCKPSIGGRLVRIVISGGIFLVCLFFYVELDLGNQSRWGGYGTWPHPLYFIAGIGAPLLGGIAAIVSIYNLVAMVLLFLAGSKSDLVTPVKSDSDSSENEG